MWCCRNILGDSWSDFHFPHWENNNNLLLPFVSNHLAIYPWRNFLSHPAAIFLSDWCDRILESPFKRNRQMLNCVPLAMELSPISLHVQRTVCCHQGKGTGEEQVHVHIPTIRAESEASVPQARSLTATDIHVCFYIICSLLLLFLYWTKTLKPLKFFCTCSSHWILPDIQRPFISAWVHSLLCSPCMGT